MGNTPSHGHGSPSGRGTGGGDTHSPGGSGLGRAPSTSRRHAPNLRLPMPQRTAAGTSGSSGGTHISPQSSNPTSPSTARPGSPRRRKSLELPDLNKLSFTPAAPVPTTSTTTTNHLAASAPTVGGLSASAPQTRNWKQTLGGHVSPTVSKTGATPLGKPEITVVPVNDNSTYFPSQPIPIRSPRGGPNDLPPERVTATRRVDVRPVDTPVRTGLTPPPPTVSTTPHPDPSAGESGDKDKDGLVDVPLQWNGGGKQVYVTGNFADNWRGRIKLKKSTHDFNTVLRLAPGQYRLKFIVDESWRCSKAIPTATDDDGTLVNYIEVEAPKNDSELQAEWAMDKKPTRKAEDMDDSQWTSDLPAPLVLYQYLEELPQMFAPEVLKQYVSTTPYFSRVPKPPQLPRILEKVILNPDPQRRPDPVDPTQHVTTDDNAILPTPTHTVLGHLMASAIKNGTLGVATSTRYRKKYCTTIFFRSSSPTSQDPPPVGEDELDTPNAPNTPKATAPAAPAPPAPAQQ